MSAESNKTIIRRLFQMIQDGNSMNVEEIFASNWVNHDPTLPPMQGFDGARQLINMWSTSLSNRKVTIEDMVAEGERVAARFTFSGTNTGPLMGIPPTGKTANSTGIGIFRVVDGKLTENWVNFDALGMLQQLGIIPAMGK